MSRIAKTLSNNDIISQFVVACKNLYGKKKRRVKGKPKALENIRLEEAT